MTLPNVIAVVFHGNLLTRLPVQHLTYVDASLLSKTWTRISVYSQVSSPKTGCKVHVFRKKGTCRERCGHHRNDLQPHLAVHCGDETISGLSIAVAVSQHSHPWAAKQTCGSYAPCQIMDLADSLSNLRGQRTGFESLRFRLATNLGESRIKPWKVYTYLTLCTSLRGLTVDMRRDG